MFAPRSPRLLHLRSPCDEHRCLHPHPPRDVHSQIRRSAHARPRPFHLRRPCSLTSRCSDISNFGARLRRRSRFRECLAAIMFALAADVHLSVIPSPRGTRLCFTPLAYALSSCGSRRPRALASLDAHVVPTVGCSRCLLIFRPVSDVLAFSVLATVSRLAAFSATFAVGSRRRPSPKAFALVNVPRRSPPRPRSRGSRSPPGRGGTAFRRSTSDPFRRLTVHGLAMSCHVFRRNEAGLLSATVFG